MGLAVFVQPSPYLFIMEKQTALEFKNISKSFGNKIANKHVSLSLYKGEILAILGENGSGKTSLMNTALGIYYPDEGQIFVNGQEASIHSPKDAYDYHIGMIHQHFKLVDVFTAIENVVLGLTKDDYLKFYNETKEINEKLIKELEEEAAKYNDLQERLEAAKIDYSETKERVLNSIKSTLAADLENYKKQIKESKDDKEKCLELKKEFKAKKVASKLEIKNIESNPEVSEKKALVYKYDIVNRINQLRKEIEQSKKFNLKASAKRVASISSKYGFNIDPYQKVYDMSVSEKQTLEIVKALYRGVDILILDEPTAVLTPQETKKLFKVLRNMASQGKSIIIITHKLNEVMEISDRVSVLRKGEYAGSVITKETNEKELTELMVGRKIELNIKRPAVKNLHERLFISGLTYTNRENVKALDNVSFVARGGEILGIAGIAGNGQRELLEAVAGLVHLDSGDIVFHNPKKNRPVTFFHKNIKQIRELAEKGAFYDADTKEKLSLKNVSNKKIREMVKNEKIMFYEDEIIDLRNKKPIEIRNLGIKLSFVPEDRLGMGLVGNMDLIDNMMLRSFRKGHSIFLNRNKPKHLAEEIVDELEVITPNLRTPVRNLSGGNIQKLLVGREISSEPKVLMVAYPVRGLDIKSSYTIYDLLNAQKERGAAVVFVGEDLDVLLALSDRILVLSGGKVSGIVDARKTTKEEIGLLMTKSTKKQEVL